LGAAFAGVGLDAGLVPLWFVRLLRDGFALTAMGDYRPVAELATDSLRGLAPDRVGEAQVGRDGRGERWARAAAPHEAATLITEALGITTSAVTHCTYASWPGSAATCR
jgi:hypothetical protein